MGKAKKSLKKVEERFIEEYNELMTNSTFKIGINQEWSERGDRIEKFTMYENYTPVKTSGGTGAVI